MKPTSKRQFLLALAASAAAPAFAQQPANPAGAHRPPTNTDESKVRDYVLPDLLRLQNGEPVRDAATWRNRRRPEIMRLLAEHQEGVTPERRIAARYQTIDRNTPALGGAARRTQVRIHFEGRNDPQGVRVLLHTPANAKGPVPTVLYLGFSPAILILPDEKGIDEGMAWAAATRSRVPDREARRVGAVDIGYFIDRGYGLAYVYNGDIDPDFQGGAVHGIRTLFEPQEGGRARRPNEWGTIGSWSWGLSRVLDWLETVPEVDAKKVSVAGVSRLGKTVLWCAAQDERFAMCMPLLSGEGGAAISRRNYGETVGDLTDPARYPYWFCPRYADYADNVDAMPVDGHFLVAAIAPRPILQITGSTDTWSDPRGEWVSMQAAKAVYALLGKSVITETEYPAPETRFFEDMGWYMHEGEHTTFPRDFAAMADFMDKHFGKPPGAA